MNPFWSWPVLAAVGVLACFALSVFITLLLRRITHSPRERAYLYKTGVINAVIMAMPCILSAWDPTHSNLYWIPAQIGIFAFGLWWFPKKFKQIREDESKDKR